jgi:hypothetical protein
MLPNKAHLNDEWLHVTNHLLKFLMFFYLKLLSKSALNRSNASATKKVKNENNG